MSMFDSAERSRGSGEPREEIRKELSAFRRPERLVSNVAQKTGFEAPLMFALTESLANTRENLFAQEPMIRGRFASLIEGKLALNMWAEYSQYQRFHLLALASFPPTEAVSDIHDVQLRTSFVVVSFKNGADAMSISLDPMIRSDIASLYTAFTINIADIFYQASALSKWAENQGYVGGVGEMSVVLEAKSRRPLNLDLLSDEHVSVSDGETLHGFLLAEGVFLVGRSLPEGALLPYRNEVAVEVSSVVADETAEGYGSNIRAQRSRMIGRYINQLSGEALHEVMGRTGYAELQTSRGPLLRRFGLSTPQPGHLSNMQVSPFDRAERELVWDFLELAEHTVVRRAQGIAKRVDSQHLVVSKSKKQATQVSIDPIATMLQRQRELLNPFNTSRFGLPSHSPNVMVFDAVDLYCLQSNFERFAPIKLAQLASNVFYQLTDKQRAELLTVVAEDPQVRVAMRINGRHLEAALHSYFVRATVDYEMCRTDRSGKASDSKFLPLLSQVYGMPISDSTRLGHKQSLLSDDRE